MDLSNRRALSASVGTGFILTGATLLFPGNNLGWFILLAGIPPLVYGLWPLIFRRKAVQVPAIVGDLTVKHQESTRGRVHGVNCYVIKLEVQMDQRAAAVEIQMSRPLHHLRAYSEADWLLAATKRDGGWARIDTSSVPLGGEFTVELSTVEKAALRKLIASP